MPKGTLREEKLKTAFSSIELGLGGRQALRELLLQEDQEEGEVRTLIQFLADPRYGRWGLNRICQEVGISFSRFLALFRKAHHSKAYANTLSAIYDRLPQVATDLVDRALPRQKVCPKCFGTGKGREIKKDRQLLQPPCSHCLGVGQVEVEPDFERQKLALQIAGLPKPPNAPTVSINNQQQLNMAQIGPLRSTVEFRDATDRLLFPGRDRTIVPPSEGES